MHKLYTLKQIETPRLIIRPVELGDEIQLNQAVNRSLVSLQTWMPWAEDPSLETTRDFIQKGVFARCSRIIANFPMVVIQKEDQIIISGSGYNDRSDPKNGLYEIGYWCDVGYQGKGYVTEYVNALTRYALSQLEAKTVVIRMEVGNVKSIAVAKRLNFVNQGTTPSATKENATDYYFTCTASDSLPPIDVTWCHEDSDNVDAKMIAWAKEALKITDDQALAGSRAIVKTPWSSVMAITTRTETVYLKHMPDQIALEAIIIEKLKDKFNAPVPAIIAKNSAFNCFLMKDAGVSLRTILKEKFDTDLLCKAIAQFTALQITAAEQVDDFIHMGVPDWRLNKFSDLYKKAISQSDLLTADGLSLAEINDLETLHPKIKQLCEKLSRYAIKETIVQPDFNDNNTLIDDKRLAITIIDLGEISISHPFFSLLNCLHVIKKHYVLTNTDATYLKIKDACLKNYTQFESEQNLSDALDIAQVLWFVYELFAIDRLMRACGSDQLMGYQRGKLSWMLKELIAACKNNVC